MNDNLLIFGGMALAAAAVAAGAGGAGGKTKTPVTTPFNQGRGNPFIDGNQFSFRPNSVRVFKKSPSTRRIPSPRSSPKKSPSSMRTPSSKK